MTTRSLLGIVLASCSPTVGQVPSGDTGRETEPDVTTPATDCSSLNIVEGDVTLLEAGAADLADTLCSEFNAVGGTLTLLDTPFETLEPVSCLCQIGGLVLDRNRRLVDGTGLANVRLVPTGDSESTAVGPSIHVNFNDALRRFAAPQMSRGADILFWSNDNLREVTGFDDLVEAEVLLILDGSFPRNLSVFPALERLGRLSVQDIELTSLSGMQTLRDCDVVHFRSVRGLESLAGLEGLDQAVLQLSANEDLQRLEGLDGLMTAGEIQITDNPMLSDVSALHGLLAVQGSLLLRDNAVSKEDLQALVDAIGEENIYDNAVEM